MGAAAAEVPVARANLPGGHEVSLLTSTANVIGTMADMLPAGRERLPADLSPVHTTVGWRRRASTSRREARCGGDDDR